MAIFTRIAGIIVSVILVLGFSTFGALIVYLTEDEHYGAEETEHRLQTDESGDQSNKPLLGRGDKKRKGRKE